MSDLWDARCMDIPVGEIILWVYLVGIPLSMLPIARWLLRSVTGHYNVDAFDIAMTAGLAIITSPVWPLLIPGIWLYAVLKAEAREHEQEHQHR